MVSKNQIKLITSLHQKKFRSLHGLFIAEGIKVIQELLTAGLEIDFLYETTLIKWNHLKIEPTLITEVELKKISALATVNNCLAVFKIPPVQKINENGLILALDTIQDPGNLGTIIRLCDWFGINNIVCTEKTVDLYNPKVIQATMGSLSRVNVSYITLATFLHKTKLPIYGTFMNGENIYKTSLKKEGIIVMGNEGNGISKEIEKLVHHPLTIPRYGNLQLTESLNVASATAIILSEFCR
jgi:RNA methyltransferase, TrmH family